MTELVVKMKNYLKVLFVMYCLKSIRKGFIVKAAKYGEIKSPM